MKSSKSKLTLPAVFAVVAFGVLGFLQVLNAILAIASIAGLVVLLTDRRYPIGIASAAGCLLISYLLGREMLLAESVFLVVLPGIIISICIRLNKQPVKAIFAVILPIILLSVVYFTRIGNTAEYYNEIAPEVKEQFGEIFITLEIDKKLGLSPEKIDQLTDDYMYFVKTIIRFMPGLMLILFTVIGTLAYKLTEFCFRREDRYLIAFPRFDHWKIDERMLLLFGIALLVVILGNGLIQDIGENVALYVFSLLTFGGLSLLENFMQRKKFKRLFKGLIYFLSLIHI